MQPAIFLDRDNTLIANDGDLGDPRKVILRDGVPEGLRALRQHGYRLVVVTNQGGVARGRFSEADVDAVHQRIAHLIDDAASSRGLIDRFYYCPYHPEATVSEYQRDHPWRKPHPGMLLQAAHDMNLDLTSSWMVGDQSRDILAGRSAGCRTILLSPQPQADASHRPTAIARSFSEAVDFILRQPPAAPEPPLAKSDAKPAPGKAAAADPQTDLRRAVHELTEELRSQRVRRGEFTLLRMLGVMGQLLTVLLAVLGLLQMSDPDSFTRWMIGAGLMQMAAIAMFVMDLRS